MRPIIVSILVVTFILLAGCQGEKNNANNVIEGRDLKEITIYEGNLEKFEDENIITTLDEDGVQEFENVMQSVTRVKEEDISVVPNYTIEVTYADNDVDSIGLQIGDEEESYLKYGKDSNSETKSFEISAKKTSKLKSLINK